MFAIKLFVSILVLAYEFTIGVTVRQEQQMAAKAAGMRKVKFGETWLFFGCRHKDRDFLYRYVDRRVVKLPDKSLFVESSWNSL